MSTIGRIFTVLNLILAAGFVVFTGTYLKESSDYRTQFNDKSEELTKAKASFDLKLKTASDNLNNVKLALSRSESAKDGQDTRIKELVAENATLAKRLIAFEGDHKKSIATLGDIKTVIKTASENADKMAKMAMDAKVAKDAALDAKEKAEASLNKANFEIKALTKQIAEQKGNIGELAQANREQKVIIDLYNSKFPGALATLQPSVSGNVETVGAGGKLVTISLGEGRDNLKPGHRFAIYSSSDGYLGEAAVTEIDKTRKYAFAKMTVRRDGARLPRSGDRAKTNLDNAGAGN